MPDGLLLLNERSIYKQAALRLSIYSNLLWRPYSPQSAITTLLFRSSYLASYQNKELVVLPDVQMRHLCTALDKVRSTEGTLRMSHSHSD